MVGGSLLPGTSCQASQEFPRAHHRAIRAHHPPSPIPHRLVHQSGIHVRFCRCDFLSCPFTDKVWFWVLAYYGFSRCLALWEGDRDLLRALELAKSFLAPTEVLNSLWPCQGRFFFFSPVSVVGHLLVFCAHAAFHLQGKALRAKLSQACASAGIPLPPSTPALLHQHHHQSGTTGAVTSSR